MAKKMKSLIFDDGYESFMVNDDPERIVRFNPADPEIINRLLEVQKMFQDYKISDNLELKADGSPKNDIERDAAYVTEFTNAMRQAFNSIFNSDVYDIIFAGQSPLCIIGKKYLFEGVFDGLKALMKPAIEEYNRKNSEKMGKYLEDLKE